MNEYEIGYSVPKSGGGMVKERITAASEQNARNLLRSKYGDQEVRIFDGRMTSFGDRRDDRDSRSR